VSYAGARAEDRNIGPRPPDQCCTPRKAADARRPCPGRGSQHRAAPAGSVLHTSESRRRAPVRDGRDGGTRITSSLSRMEAHG
jgi:hypothetical protein